MEDRNPSPPPEFENDELYRADSVGSTAISKQWVISTLMEIINEVETHTDVKEEVVEVSDDLQDSACKLWDICVDKEIAVYLLEFDIIEILYGVIFKSKSPRLTEIAVGILGNMACNDTACKEISKLNHLRSVVIALLASPDTPTLLEVVRLIKISTSLPSCSNYWMSSIVENLDDFVSSSHFILSSSTNRKLLCSLSEVLDLMFEESNAVLLAFCNKDFVVSLLEAVSQQCQDDPSNSLTNLCHSLHALHLLSESEQGPGVIESVRRHLASLLSSLFYLWMTSHPKVVYSNETRMSSSEVTVSCCLSLAAIALAVEDESRPANEDNVEANHDIEEVSKNKNVDESNHDKNHLEKNENGESFAVDDEDEEMIIKFSRSVLTAKGNIFALPLVSSIKVDCRNSNEFKTPLFAKNSPGVATPVSNSAAKAATGSDTPVQTPENHSLGSIVGTPSRDETNLSTPASNECDDEKKIAELPSVTLCNLAKKVLKVSKSQEVNVPAKSPRKGIV